MKTAKVAAAQPITVEYLAGLTDFYQEQLSDANINHNDPDNTVEWRAALLRDLEAARAQYSVENDVSQFHTRLAVLQYREAQRAAV